MMGPRIENLTQRQKVLCDTMWQMQSPEAVQRFIDSLPRKTRTEAETLRQIIVMECLEPYLDHYEEDAKDLIDRCSHS